MRAGTVVVWAGFFLWLWISGGMTRYIGPRTSWVVPFGAITLTVVALAQLKILKRSGDRRPLGRSDLLGGVLLVLPLLAVAIVPSADLGSLAASRKTAGAAVAPALDETTAPVENPSFIDIEYAAQSDRYARVTGVDEGRSVRLVGFVSDHLDPAEDTFELTRFYISCCAADAVPHSVVVDAPASVGPDELEVDAWVRVEAELERRGDELVLAADSVEAVETPESPYLY